MQSDGEGKATKFYTSKGILALSVNRRPRNFAIVAMIFCSFLGKVCADQLVYSTGNNLFFSTPDAAAHANVPASHWPVGPMNGVNFLEGNRAYLYSCINPQGTAEPNCFSVFAWCQDKDSKFYSPNLAGPTPTGGGNGWFPTNNYLYCKCAAGQKWNAITSACIGYSVSSSLPPKPQCNSCGVQAPIPDPINAATGAMFDTKSDVIGSSAVSFKRFYNSTDTSGTSLSTGWEQSYGRKVVTQYSTIATQTYLQSGSTSSQYADPATACTSGFDEIKSKVPQWTNALAAYTNGNCVLTKNGAYVGAVPISVSGGTFAPAPTPVAYDVVRDDGQLIRFIIDGSGSFINPPGINLKLQKTASGFAITDSNDNVEQYDTNGKLLSITSRSGVAQTMSYDGSGRLSNVSDSFGHQLNFGYDGQGRLSVVARQ
jgi:YD repeat-containing protein